MPDDAKRFFRYVLPGLACLTELLIVLFITGDPALKTLTSSDGGSKFIEILVGALVASGGLGFLFSAVYFTTYWVFGRWLAVDHAPSFREAGFQLPADFCRREGWDLMSQIWHSQVKNPAIEGVTPVTARLSNTMHGLGTTATGSILVFTLWFCKWGYDLCPFQLALGSAFWAFVVIAYVFSFLNCRASAQTVINSTLLTVLRERQSIIEHSEPIFFVSSDRRDTIECRLEPRPQFRRVLPE